MYDPKGNGKDKAVSAVEFDEATPPVQLRNIVHRFLRLRTSSPLSDDYRFHALPDGCAYIVLDQMRPAVSGITRLRAASEEFNLGKEFHFVNIRFLPGIWRGPQDDISHGLVSNPYVGALPLRALNEALIGQQFLSQQRILTTFVEQLMADGLVAPNQITATIFRHLDAIHSVADMAAVCELSPRHLQRVLKQSTGLAPHDFLKILRLQQSINGEPSASYADQSHFIHSFRNATGYTPVHYTRKYDV